MFPVFEFPRRVAHCLKYIVWSCLELVGYTFGRVPLFLRCRFIERKRITARQQGRHEADIFNWGVRTNKLENC